MGFLLTAGGPVRLSAGIDIELAKGIQQVDDGEFDAAILTLDHTTRRLAAEPSRTEDLAQAYLYLGVAYLGKGAEASARAQFREALARVKDLKLSPDKFAPKVIEMFQKARDEVSTTAQAAPTTPATPPAHKGGSSKGLLIAGGIAVAAGGVALAAGGGSSGSSSPPTTLPAVRTERRDGFVNLTTSQEPTFSFGPTQAGHWTIELSWDDSNAPLVMQVWYLLGQPTQTFVEYAQATGLTSSRAEFDGLASQTYSTVIYIDKGHAQGTQTNFHIIVTHPLPLP